MLASYDFRGWPNGDDAAVMRGGQIGFVVSDHSFFLIAWFICCYADSVESVCEQPRRYAAEK